MSETFEELAARIRKARNNSIAQSAEKLNALAGRAGRTLPYTPEYIAQMSADIEIPKANVEILSLEDMVAGLNIPTLGNGDILELGRSFSVLYNQLKEIQNKLPTYNIADTFDQIIKYLKSKYQLYILDKDSKEEKIFDQNPSVESDDDGLKIIDGDQTGRLRYLKLRNKPKPINIEPLPRDSVENSLKTINNPIELSNEIINLFKNNRAATLSISSLKDILGQASSEQVAAEALTNLVSPPLEIDFLDQNGQSVTYYIHPTITDPGQKYKIGEVEGYYYNKDTNEAYVKAKFNSETGEAYTRFINLNEPYKGKGSYLSGNINISTIGIVRKNQPEILDNEGQEQNQTSSIDLSEPIEDLSSNLKNKESVKELVKNICSEWLPKLQKDLGKLGNNIPINEASDILSKIDSYINTTDPNDSAMAPVLIQLKHIKEKLELYLMIEVEMRQIASDLQFNIVNEEEWQLEMGANYVFSGKPKNEQFEYLGDDVNWKKYSQDLKRIREYFESATSSDYNSSDYKLYLIDEYCKLSYGSIINQTITAIIHNPDNYIITNK